MTPTTILIHPPERHRLVLRAVSPISHGDTLTGADNATNTRLFMRQAAILGGVVERVPAISENALRSVAFRQPLADHLLDALGIGPGELPQAVMNLLYSGGSMAAGTTAPDSQFELEHRLRKLYPSLELLGGSVDRFVLSGSRLKLTAWLVAREYLPWLELVMPEETELLAAAAQVSAFELLAEETRTRGTGSESEGNQMLYSYETLAAGAQVIVEITLDGRTSPAARAAVAVALTSWDKYFGGQARQGRGRMHVERPLTIDPAPYLDHLAAHGEAMRAGLLDGTFGTGTVLCAR
ncbi:MAG: hypothetical protein KatS3mg060_1133 [Dehalococcoidia bacterium]|nr:MAG: hypothetical protein KatS3mg060_1133 [Dehalococcoidia bacterium]